MPQTLTCAGGGCLAPANCALSGQCMRLLGADPEAAGDTDKSFPPSKGARALAKAVEQIGQRESGGRNQGPIVEWSCKWWFDGRKDPRYAAWYSAGRLAWCAAFAGRCYLEAGMQGLADYWSIDCDSLLVRLASHREWQVQQWPCEVQPGDVVFFGHRDDIRHVELGERLDAASGALYTVGGNTTRTTDRVARCERLAAAADIYAVAHAL